MKKSIQQASEIRGLSAGEIAKIRTRLTRTVCDLQNDVEMVMLGGKKWSTVQLNLYKLLLNKVLPDISTSYSETTDLSTRRISGLSRQELEEMVAQRSNKEIVENYVKNGGNTGDLDDEAATSDSDSGKKD